jgi:hypothetical protein
VLSRKLQDGVVFVSECVNHIFKPRELLCPICNGALREEIAAGGRASLFCSAPGPSCVSPVKTFESEREMYRWRDSIWEVIGRACRGQD